MRNLIDQAPRFVFLGVAVALVLLGCAWWSVPAWVLTAMGAGCRKAAP